MGAQDQKKKRVLVVGAGAAGELLDVTFPHVPDDDVGRSFSGVQPTSMHYML